MRLHELAKKIDFVNDYDTDPFETYLKTEVVKQYDVPYDEPAYEPANVNGSVSDKESVEELVQHLTDLGYFGEDELFALTRDGVVPASFNESVERYFDDDFTLNGQYNIPKADLADSAFIDFLPIANERLSVLTSLDGEMIEEVELRKGDTNIYTRVLHFRVTTLGLYTKSIAAPISEDSVAGAYLVLLITRQINHDRFGDEMLRKRITGQVFKQLNNVYSIAAALQAKYFRHQLGFYFLESNLTAEASFPFMFSTNDGLITDFKERDFIAQLRNQDVPRWQWSQNQPDASLLYDQQVTFAKRLLQVLLWMNGFYPGRLDGVWGAVTHQSLLDFIKLQDIEDRRKLLVYTGNGIWAFSFAGILSRVLSYQQPVPLEIRRAVGGDDSRDDEIALQDIDNDKAMLLEAMEDNLADEAERPEQEPEKIGFVRRFFNRIKDLGRRVYYGARSLITNAIKGLKDIWRFIRDEVVGPAVNFFRHLFKQIRQGIRTFFAGMKRFFCFLLRKPFASVEGKFMVITKFDLDHDCVRYTSQDCPSALLVSHQEIITKLTYQVTTFVRIAGKIIAMLITMTTPFGWIKLALKIGKIILNEIRSRVRKNKEE